MYTEHQPSCLLAPYIDNYRESRGTPEYGMRIHILLGGCIDFIFMLGEAVSKVKEEALVIQPYCSYSVGPMAKYSELITYAEFVHQLGVRFLSCGLSGFTKLPLYEFMSYGVSANEVQMISDNIFIERLCERNNTRGRIQVVEEYLLVYLVHNYQPVDTQIVTAVNIIDQSAGKCSVRSLMDEVCLCQCYFERKFKYNTGSTPKEYSRIVEFKNAVELLRNTTFTNLLIIATDVGYYDLVYFSKEIKTLSGNASSSFLSLTVPEDITLTYIEPQHRVNKSRFFTIERTSVSSSL